MKILKDIYMTLKIKFHHKSLNYNKHLLWGWKYEENTMENQQSSFNLWYPSKEWEGHDGEREK